MRYKISFDVKIDDEDLDKGQAREIPFILKEMILENFDDYGAIFRCSVDGDGWIDRESRVVKSTIRIEKK